MRRTTLLFAAAIVLPSLLLGGLALRSARHQQLVIENQATDLYQAFTDQLAQRSRLALKERQRAFEARVDAVIGDDPAGVAAARFDEDIAGLWPDVEMGFAVTQAGRLLAPRRGDPRAEAFLAGHEGFLTNRTTTDFFQIVQNAMTPEGSTQVVQKGSQGGFARIIQPSKTRKAAQPERPADSPPLPFQEIAAGAMSGELSRFVEDRLELLFWKRAETRSDVIFGLSLRPEKLEAVWRDALSGQEDAGDEFCLALLDERARVVAVSDPDFNTDWTRPFVATEIGEVLPYWEAALYLKHPERLGRDTRVAQLSLVLMIFVSLAAIVAGGVLIARDTRRRLEWARVRSDFVSSVSHELKTPLTSIRMFAELLDRQPGVDSDKSREFVRVIRHESERLSRLVENVLDFDKLQRGAKTVNVVTFDAYPVIRRVFETLVEPLTAQGFDARWDAADPPYTVRGDADAVFQILVNLVANSEKYSEATKELLLTSEMRDGELVVRVQDRGPGVAPENAEKLFDAFFRQEVDGKPGVSGSGLGLHIARQLAQSQEGTLTYRPRPGGGSIFSLHLQAGHEERR